MNFIFIYFCSITELDKEIEVLKSGITSIENVSISISCRKYGEKNQNSTHPHYMFNVAGCLFKSKFDIHV